MSLTSFSLPLLQSSLVKQIASWILVVFLVLLSISAIYFAFSYLGKSSNEYEDLMVGEDQAATRRVFKVVAGVSVIGVIIGGVVLHDGNKGDGEGQQANKVSLYPTLFTSKSPSKQTESKENPKQIQGPPVLAEIVPSAEAVAKVGTAYSGKELIKLYKSLPENATIHCDLEVTGKFEECMVYEGPVPVDSSRSIEQCCFDKNKLTWMFTTIIRDQVSGQIGLTTKYCSEQMCDEDVLADKKARNELYDAVADPNFDGFKPNGSGTLNIMRNYLEPQKDLVFQTVMLEAPNGFDQNLFGVNNSHNAAMLYKLCLTTARLKMDQVRFLAYGVNHFFITNYYYARTFSPKVRPTVWAAKAILDEWDNIKSTKKAPGKDD